MKIKPTIAEIEAALDEFGQDRVGFGPDGELVVAELKGVPPLPRSRTTHTYATTNIVILGGVIYAEDFSHDTSSVDVPDRVAAILDRDHLRKFGDFEGKTAMHLFTMWLHDKGAVVDQCAILGAELSDAERQA